MVVLENSVGSRIDVAIMKKDESLSTYTYKRDTSS